MNENYTLEQVKEIIQLVIEDVLIAVVETDVVLFDKLCQIDKKHASELYEVVCETYRKCKYENTSTTK